VRALIMAGGEGSRLGRGEKPLTLVCGRPMISFVADAFHQAGLEPVAVVSPRTPMTTNWCRAHGIAVVRTEGSGYIGDMICAVRHLEETRPLVVSVSDIPGIIPAIITTIMKTYDDCGKDALSVWIPAHRVQSCRGGMPYHERIGGIEACPAGVNILRGDGIGEEQDEFALLLDEPRLALNVNTPADLARAEASLSSDTAH
jgi:adenosylcobinamide-phosphate guanylyltransferase